jgi:hypothetical protein
VQARGVLGQAAVAHFGEPELALGDPERVFHVRPQRGPLPVASDVVCSQGAAARCAETA